MNVNTSKNKEISTSISISSESTEYTFCKNSTLQSIGVIITDY